MEGKVVQLTSRGYDPIDGTKAFTGIPTWGILLSLVENKPIMGIIYQHLPRAFWGGFGKLSRKKLKSDDPQSLIVRNVEV